MQGYNLLAVYDASGEKLLMCKRRKDPYKGLLNLIGGKIEAGEDGLAAAYRELWEESAITGNDIALTHLMDFAYHVYDCYVEVYFGRLNKPVAVSGSENDLVWADLNQSFFDSREFAGEGNIGHIVETIDKLRCQNAGR